MLPPFQACDPLLLIDHRRKDELASEHDDFETPRVSGTCLTGVLNERGRQYGSKIRPLEMPSDIHVFVKFQDQCVFAGEELKCTITFKNVLDHLEPQTPVVPARRNSRTTSIGKLAAAAARQPSAQADRHITRVSSRQASHGSTGLGLSGLGSPSIPGDHSPQSAPEGSGQTRRQGHKQQRSISIISGGSPVVSQGKNPLSSASGQRPAGAHRRSSTIQLSTIGQRRQSQYHQEQSLGLHLQSQSGRRSPFSLTTPSTPAAESRRSTPDFQFPPRNPQDAAERPSREPSPRDAAPRAASPRAGRVVSTSSQVASERNSGEFYSLSNHSQETLMSEQPSILSDKPQIPSSLMRKDYKMRSQQPRRIQAANLLMGYANLNATFTLDGSLVDQSQFEEVKKKGFLGGQAGGGVVGVNKARPQSSFLGGFSFNSIGDSFNSLVGAENLSSVKEMNAVTNSRAIPLLSTPQSLLFVDLRLEPGEQKSYSFSCILPRGLPSSYRGKSIKISYNILIGVQGIPGTRDVHKVRQISVPVRVFSGVDSDGDVLGHDLMQPHVVLRDLARTKSIDPNEEREKPLISSSKKNGNSDDFLKYVDTLLDRNRRRQSSSGTMDVMAGAGETPDASPTVQAINKAILNSNRFSADSDSSSNRFEISRGGLRVAVVMIDRNLHRLGETVTVAIDFSDRDVSCASLHATLETTEKVSASLAVRSAASINRVTRRVYAAHSDNVLFSKRAVFAPTIPTGATPTFVTSGISLEWSLRFEFGTVKAVEDEEGGVNHEADLFEDVVKDERGTVSIAVERLECETFEVVIPITVYGDVVRDTDEEKQGIGIPI